MNHLGVVYLRVVLWCFSYNFVYVGNYVGLLNYMKCIRQGNLGIKCINVRTCLCLMFNRVVGLCCFSRTQAVTDNVSLLFPGLRGAQLRQRADVSEACPGSVFCVKYLF